MVGLDDAEAIEVIIEPGFNGLVGIAGPAPLSIVTWSPLPAGPRCAAWRRSCILHTTLATTGLPSCSGPAHDRRPGGEWDVTGEDGSGGGPGNQPLSAELNGTSEGSAATRLASSRWGRLRGRAQRTRADIEAVGPAPHPSTPRCRRSSAMPSPRRRRTGSGCGLPSLHVPRPVRLRDIYRIGSGVDRCAPGFEPQRMRPTRRVSAVS